MNLIVFVLLGWGICTVIAWCCDYLPEICRERRAERMQKWNAAIHEIDGETTVQMPGGSFDPDETMKLMVKKVRDPKTHEIQVVFVMDKRPPFVPRRRHAKA